MHRVPGSRTEHPDLLTRTRPANPPEDPWAALLVDPAAQLAELADLVERGLATPDEFERQRRKVFGDSEPTTSTTTTTTTTTIEGFDHE